MGQRPRHGPDGRPAACARGTVESALSSSSFSHHRRRDPGPTVCVGSAALLLAWWCLLSSAEAASRKGGRTLLSSNIVDSIFMAGKGTDGWTVQGSQRESGVQRVEGPVARESDMAIEVADVGAQVWYFTSPSHFAGDKTAAYNGKISFGLYHKQRPPASSSHDQKLGRVGVGSADVILEAQCGHEFYLSGVLRAREVPTEYSFSLAEDAGWIDSRTGNAPLRKDMLGLLAHLYAVKIRGFFYRGPETVRLYDVSISPAAQGTVSGRDLFPCCSSKHAGEMDVCNRAKDTDLTPQGLRFDCKGSFKPVVKIRTIFPRFARRSGGALVTVVGENFGMTGSNTILRVNGRRARKCRYPTTEFIAANAPPPAVEIVAHCKDGEWQFGEDGVDCGGSDCPLCILPITPAHCLNGILDEALGETHFGITPDNMGATHDCGGPCVQPEHCCDNTWQETEAAINCGGSDCFPCEMPSMPVGTAVEREVLSSGAMSARGCFCFVKMQNLTIECPPNNASAFTASVPARVPTENLLHITEELQEGPPHDYDDMIGSLVNTSSCDSVAFLDEQEVIVHDDVYTGKYLVITGGPGAGQVAKILAYDRGTRMTSLAPWHRGDEQRNAQIDTQGFVHYQVGAAVVEEGGSGYRDGIWEIPVKYFKHNSTIRPNAVIPQGAWGTFKVETATGRIMSVDIVNAGRFESEFVTGNGQRFVHLLVEDIKCTSPCAGAGAKIRVDFSSNEIVPPTMQSTYIIVNEDTLQSPRGNRLGNVVPRPGIAQHETLICELEDGEGKDLKFDVQSEDGGETAVSSCYNEYSRGFEYGAHDNVWSLQFGIRQGEQVKEITITAIDIDKRTADMYVTGTILGACNEGTQGCFGVVGSHLPDRGRKAAGDFTPVFLDPFGATSGFIMKLNKHASPQWATMMDSQSQFGRIDPSSLTIDATGTTTHIYVGGMYVTPSATTVHFWHVNPRTRRPTRIARSEVVDGGGTCNIVACVEGVCSSTLPEKDQLQCANRRGGFVESESCRIARCAYVTGFESQDEVKTDAWLAQISSEGRWIWVKTRMGTSRRGALLIANGVKLATTSLGYESPVSAASSAVYVTFSLELAPHQWPDLTFSLGNVAREFWGLDVDEEDLDVLTVNLPTCDTTTRFAVLAKFSAGGVLWSRGIGPLGPTGGMIDLKTDGTHLFLAGNYDNATAMYASNAPTFETCVFGHPTHTAAPDSQVGKHALVENSGVLPPFTNARCFPFRRMHAHYTLTSFQRTKSQQWDDISGHEMHASVSRGKVEVGHRGPSHGAESIQFFLQGTKNDGMRFPKNSIPAQFTICSISRMPTLSKGTILDSSDIGNWAHGHYGGHPAQSWYGTVNFQTTAGISKDGRNSWEDHFIEKDDWVIMCGQNRETDAVFLANGVNTGISSGGRGGGQLTVNDGLIAPLRGHTDWELIEIAIWDTWLSRYDVEAIMMYYQDLLRTGSKAVAQRALVTGGIRNLFVAKYSLEGQLLWHREAVGGNLTTSAMALSQRDLARGGIDRSLRAKGLLDQDEVEEHWVYITGHISGEFAPADFGVTKYPTDCSAPHTLGEYLTLRHPGAGVGGGRSDDGIHHSPCSGQAEFLKSRLYSIISVA